MANNYNPYDDFLKSLAKLVEDLMNELPDDDHARFIGCTIIAGVNPDTTPFFPGAGNEQREIKYEVIESDDRIFITTQLPPDIKNAPYADIDPDSVRLCIDDLDAKIPMPVRIDVIHSFYMVRHGVMDVVLKKKPTTPDIN